MCLYYIYSILYYIKFMITVMQKMIEYIKKNKLQNNTCMRFYLRKHFKIKNCIKTKELYFIS